MKLEIKNAKNWMFNGLADRRPIKLAAGLALGAVVLAGTAGYLGTGHYQEGRGPLAASAAVASPASEGIAPHFALLQDSQANLGRIADLAKDIVVFKTPPTKLARGVLNTGPRSKKGNDKGIIVG